MSNKTLLQAIQSMNESNKRVVEAGGYDVDKIEKEKIQIINKYTTKIGRKLAAFTGMNIQFNDNKFTMYTPKGLVEISRFKVDWDVTSNDAKLVLLTEKLLDYNKLSKSMQKILIKTSQEVSKEFRKEISKF